MMMNTQMMYHLPPAQRFMRDPESLHVNMRKLKLQTLKKYVRLNRIQMPSRASTHQELAKIVAKHFCSTLQQVTPNQQNGRSKKKSTFWYILFCVFNTPIFLSLNSHSRIEKKQKTTTNDRESIGYEHANDGDAVQFHEYDAFESVSYGRQQLQESFDFLERSREFLVLQET